jgi:hypothetical protein
LDISHLENEKAGIEKTIQDFDIQYNRALGQLLMQILAQRRQIAAHQAAQNPQDPEAQDRHKDTENDYAQYHKNYEAAAAKTLNALTDNEQRLLKKRFREATKLCYPTVVAEPFKEAATALFIELRQAYAENNLGRVTEIADYLQHGKPYHPQHTVGGEKHHIRAVIDRLRSRRAQLRAALQALRTHDTFNTLQHINDWNTYFDNQKAALQARLDKLNEEWTRINK